MSPVVSEFLATMGLIALGGLFVVWWLSLGWYTWAALIENVWEAYVAEYPNAPGRKGSLVSWATLVACTVWEDRIGPEYGDFLFWPTLLGWPITLAWASQRCTHATYRSWEREQERHT